ncbi:MAG TPA: prolyl oligopeptidase family serine peptidase [Candidatus Cloacimonadota bacterium]|nr:prolyl oligopeptidase family serine peptidase [Candidatus Cloacimonadota bacterium]
MIKRLLFTFTMLSAAIWLAGFSLRPKVPFAQPVPDTLSVHKMSIVDNWSWLKDREDPRLPGVLKAEAVYTKKTMSSSRGLAKKLYKEFEAFEPKDYQSYPYLRNGYYYYTREKSGKSYPIHCRIKDNPKAREEVILDENKLAKGHEFFALGAYSISFDGRWLAYSVDFSGDENYSLFIKDLNKDKTHDTGIPGVSECLWKSDDKTLILSRINGRYQTDTVWSYDRTTKEEKLLYTELDAAWDISLYYSGNYDLIFLLSSSKDTSEAQFMPSRGLENQFRLLTTRSQGHIYYPDYYSGLFYIQSNRLNPDYTIYLCHERSTILESWKVVVPGVAGSPITGFMVFDKALVVLSRQDGFERLSIWDRSGDGLRYTLPQSELVDLAFWTNTDLEADHFYYTRESELTPLSIVQHNFISRTDSLEYQYKPAKDFYPEKYKTELKLIKAKDGTDIPLRLAYRADLDLSQPHSLMLYGYGAYGDVEDPYFSTTLFPLLDRGLIYAVANIRGGGEFGKGWYDAGRLHNKITTFTDFIACIDWLIDNGITTKNRLAINGGSAGGLLIGAVVNLAPGKMKLAIADVPFVDPLNTMLDPNLPLTIQEYEEWGDPRVPEDFEYILSYSPYDNVSLQEYPNVLISAAWHDSRVGYWEGLKWAQKLRTQNTGYNSILFRLNQDEGHTGSGDRFKSLREYSRTMGYMLRLTGIKK